MDTAYDAGRHPVLFNKYEIIFITAVVIVLTIYLGWCWWTQLDPAEMDELNDIMMNFHRDPNYEDFERVFAQRNKIARHAGKPAKFWLWGVYIAHPEFYDDDKKMDIRPWIREIERGIRRVATSPSPELMDCVWSIYFATGDESYPEIIRRIAAESNVASIRNAARWSYRSIMKREWNAPRPDTAAGTANADVTETAEDNENDNATETANVNADANAEAEDNENDNANVDADATENVVTQ